MRWRIAAHDTVLKVLGILLLTAAVLKGHELLTVPMANRDLWSWRPFLIFQVEFELAMGIWLLSGIFKRLAWLAALGCFSLFCCVTLYKGLAGAASCGCFGTIQVNPWITLVMIDLPAAVSLVRFRPLQAIPTLHCSLTLAMRMCSLSSRVLRRFRSSGARQSHLKIILGKPLASLSSTKVAIAVSVLIMVFSVTAPILALGKPPLVTSTYEVLEPETWVGKELPILDRIDVGEELRLGNWLILFYHHGCPHCRKIIPRYEQMANDLQGSEVFLRIAMIEVPPYGQSPIGRPSSCTLGRMDRSKVWLMTTPVAVLIRQGQVLRPSWGEETPFLDAVIRSIVDS